MCFLFVTEERRLNWLKHILEREHTESEKDIGHPHNAYSLIKYWRNVVNVIEDDYSFLAMNHVMEESGIALPKQSDIEGKSS